ncbi:hypothetical protein Patl1_31221 [Pistacia atlantica]|uniref:Uncharacterized protein n=1 Tax=Pistacia atlantica TaxID=434234 RepID=A0ACC1AAM7_9ROSI|nr:hypothetical protein Patl1_31221 [Pistacia atlantica]
MKKQGKRSNRLVLVPGSFQGHLNPMLQLGTILYSQGFSITVAHTKFNSPNPSNHPDFNFLTISYAAYDSELSSGNILALILRLNVNCKALFQECLARLTEKQNSDEEKISCIIYDELMYFSSGGYRDEASEHYLAHGGITAFISRDATVPTSEGNNFLQGLGSKDLVPGFYPLRLKDLPFSKFGSLETMTQVVKELRNTRKSSAIIYNTIDFLEQSSLARTLQQCHLPLFSIGPLHKFAPALSTILFDEDISCMRWLDEQTNDNKIIYVSLGSITQIDENELAEMAWGLANKESPFLWVVRSGSVRGSEWIESLPEGFEEAIGQRGCIVKWAPQKKVLAHAKVGGFWSHCGWNSTMESISEGVPIICRQNSGDQRVNGRYISNVWRVGLEMENELNRREVERVVRRLMVDKEGLEIRQNAKELKEKIQLCVREDGSSYNSLNELVKFIKSL